MQMDYNKCALKLFMFSSSLESQGDHSSLYGNKQKYSEYCCALHFIETFGKTF